MNPFDINTMPVDKMSDLFYREDIVEAIRENVDTRKQTVILGVEGVGKTSLLKCAFDRKYRIEKAKNGTLISAVTEFPSSLKDDEIYNHFAEMIVSSVRILAQCGKTEEMEQIVKECKSIRDEGDAPEVYFEKIATTVCHNYEYRIVMVVDNFERFTSSMDITMKHHELLRKLLNWMQYIVATNYDLNEDSLPPGLSGSFFLMTFAQNEIRVGGWSAEQTKEYIEYSLCDSEIKFSEKCIANIHSVTGGIPYLLKMAAHYAYDYIEREKTEEGLKYADLYNQKIVQTILFHWCKMLTPMQIAALRALLKCADDNKIDKAKLRCLYQRGILENRVDEEPQDDEYIFCCRLLGLFCKEGKLELAAAENPLKGISQETAKDNDLSVSELIEVLKEKINEEHVTKEQLLQITKTLCGYMPNVTATIDLDEELSDDILERYSLSRAYISSFSQKVQDFLHTGIQMDRCFENVSIEDFDYSPVYVAFCKAIESHLNETIVPIMLKVRPNLRLKSGETITSYLSNHDSVMLGDIKTILTKRQSGTYTNFCDELADYCATCGLNYPVTWWRAIASSIEKIKESRNDCPHTTILKDEVGKKMLKEMFSKVHQDPNKTFMIKCLNAYNDICNPN